MNSIKHNVIRLKGLFVVSFLLVVLFIGCLSTSNEKPYDTFIKGNFQFPTGDKIYFFSYKDSFDLFLGKKSVIDSSIVDENGNYTFSLPIRTSCAFDLVYGKKKLTTNLFLSKGDKIEINFIGKNNLPIIKKSGAESKYNNYLLQFLDSFYKDPVLKPQYYIASNYMDVDQFETYTDQRKQQQIGFFNSFFRGDSLRQDFRDYAVNTIEYGIAVDRLVYLWKKRMKVMSVFPDSSYYFYDNTGFLEKKSAFSCPAYIHFLNLYIMESYERRLEKGEIKFDSPESLKPQVEKYKLAHQLLIPPYRDVVLYNIIKSDMNYASKEDKALLDSDASWNEMMAWFKNKYLVQ